MAVSAPAKDTKKAGPAPLVPPDEKFWKRYSPHGEAPLSVAGSVAVHALAVGSLVLFGLFIVSLFNKSDRSLPVEPVRLELGGGGGNPKGVGDGKGIGGPANDIGEKSDTPQIGEENAEKRPSLSPVEMKKLEEKYDDASAHRINKSRTGRTMTQLEDSIQKQLRDSVNAAGYGQGGPGEGGGKGTGKGKGKGPGTGDGPATLTQREKRMLRWFIDFSDVKTGAAYLAQLRGLGAILAFPVSSGRDVQYKVVRDLKPGGQLIDEDISKLNRIYWFDDNPRSVSDILEALRITSINPTPGRFVAFMPKELEDNLYDMERRYVEKTLRKTFVGKEDDIEETRFRAVLSGGRYKPELISVKMK
jgi:hypothetical protein